MSGRKKSPEAPSVDFKQVERLADLSRLSLDEREAERLRRELSSILAYFAALDKVDVPKDVAGQEVAPDGGQREDVTRPSAPEEILNGVPRRKGRYVRAPRVF